MNQEQEMFALIEAWEKSGQKQANFCVAHGINLGKFGYWRTKWLALHPPTESESGSSFIPIEKATPPKKKQSNLNSVETSESYEIIYPNGVRLRLPSLDFPILKELINCYV